MKQTNNNPIEVKYDGIKNITYEFLEKSVFSADIGNPNISTSDTIIDITPMRYYQGKVFNNSAKIGFRITVTGPYEISGSHEKGLVKKFIHHIEKIVFVADEKRIEVDLGEMRSQKPEEYVFLVTEIVGLENKSISAKQTGWQWDDAWKDFVLQPDDIKCLAEAKNVGVYFEAYNLIDANGGNINFRDSDGSFQIEGIQGAMRRAYHYFVDETCYADYCDSFLKRKQKILKEEEQRIDKETRQLIKQLKIEAEELDQEVSAMQARWFKKRNRTLVILLVSIVLFIIGVVIINSAFLLGSLLGFLGFYGVIYSISLLKDLYRVNKNDNNES